MIPMGRTSSALSGYPSQMTRISVTAPASACLNTPSDIEFLRGTCFNELCIKFINASFPNIIMIADPGLARCDMEFDIENTGSSTPFVLQLLTQLFYLTDKANQ